MKRKLIVCILIFFCLCRPGFSQFLYDTLYYKKLYDRPMFSVYQQVYKYNLIISSKAGEPVINYQAESLNEIGFSYSKNKFSIGLNLFGSPPADEARKVKTRYYNLGATYCDKNYLKEFYFQWFNGFYDVNTLRFPNQADKKPVYFQNKSMNVINVRYTGTRFKNYQHFSYNAVTRGLHKQRKSSSSFLYASQYAFQHVNSKSIIPDSLKRFYGSYKGLHGNTNISVLLSGGYTATIVLARSFFINGYGYLGLGLADNIFIFSNRPFENFVQFTSNGGTRFSIGYHGKHWYVISSSNFDFNFTRSNRISFSHQTFKNIFSAGYRI
jgi:hypothetical protein